MSEHDVGSLPGLTEGEARVVDVNGAAFVLCLHEGEVCALHGICTHEDLSLDGGIVEDGVLTCPWHGARYDVRTGRVLALPAVRPLRVYRARVDDGGRIPVEIGE
jgi:3-phenylpropionate/trans-cinnamate dioxygenase ferredoxin component